MNLRIILAAAAIAFATSTSAFTPRTGHWYDATQDGTGYNIDIQDGQIVITVYSYKVNGDSEWYIATGSMIGGQKSFTGTLTKLRNGACISCQYVKPSLAGNDGTITVNFLTETSATVTKPGGLVANIKPLNFGFGDPPTALLGEWVFVENIGGVYFADHYNFTTVGAASPTGTGLVADLTRYAACEYQASGTFAGNVVCFHWSSSSLTTVVDQYIFRLGLDQTFGGSWVSPTFNLYAMKGNIWVSRLGFSKSMETASGNQADSQTDSFLKRQAELSVAGQSSKSMATNDEATAMASLEQQARIAILGLR